MIDTRGHLPYHRPVECESKTDEDCRTVVVLTSDDLVAMRNRKMSRETGSAEGTLKRERECS